jgi:hypothetical protein
VQKYDGPKLEQEGSMTYLEAVGIKQDFTVAMQFADACGKTRREACTEVAKKYSPEKLTEALIVLNNSLEKEKSLNKALFALVIKIREGL